MSARNVKRLCVVRVPFIVIAKRLLYCVNFVTDWKTWSNRLFFIVKLHLILKTHATDESLGFLVFKNLYFNLHFSYH